MTGSGQGLSDLIDAFVSAAALVLTIETGSAANKGETFKYRAPLRSPDEVTILVGVSGSRLKGVVLYAMSEVTALNLASAMIGELLPDFDVIAESAVAELANIITGNASMELERKGYPCRLSPPSVIAGEGLLITLAQVGIVTVKLLTEHGELTILLAVKEVTGINGPA